MRERQAQALLSRLLLDSVCRRYMDERLEGEPPKPRERVPLRQNKPWKPAPAPPSTRASHNHQVSRLALCPTARTPPAHTSVHAYLLLCEWTRTPPAAQLPAWSSFAPCSGRCLLTPLLT